MQTKNAREGALHGLELTATGYALPAERVDNDAFFARCAWPPADAREALEAETGVRARRWCAPDESALALATRAVEMALADAPGIAAEIDVVLVTSSTTTAVLRPPDPADAGTGDIAPRILQQLGRSDALGIDLKACYCAGFLRALQVMDGLLANPNLRAGLIVSVERSSPFCFAPGNQSNFTFIFADAAGAAIVRRTAPTPGRGLIDTIGLTDVDKLSHIFFDPDGLSVGTRGAALKHAAIDLMVDCGRTLLTRNALTPNDITWLLPLQTSAGVVAPVAEGLGFSRDKLIWHGDETGFSGSASIPAALAEHQRRGTIRPGDKILSVAVGAGLNAGGALYTA